MVHYHLPGSRRYQERLFPNPALLDPEVKKNLGLRTFKDVIRHFTAGSLREDGIKIREGSLRVEPCGLTRRYTVSFEPLPESARQAEHFAAMHVAMLDEDHAGLALKGAETCRKTPAWNPMAGYPVNGHDGPSEWLPCLPLGMPIANQRAVTLLHYPPIVAYRTADYLNNMTLRRWALLLERVGIVETRLYHSILDVNPIAAPGSGESEYPNDFFPINLTSQFFDDEGRGLTYVRSMLELLLNPPHNADNPYTLPLLVCGSPLYDPQAPGWFRTRYKDQLPKNAHGSPTVDVLQTGTIRLSPSSPKLTPYLIANHMIAAGVTGTCQGDPAKIPHIRKYEAQDLVGATFLKLFEDAVQEGKPFEPEAAKKAACQRWFGTPDGSGAPNPPDPDDRLVICALAQMDLCFDARNVKPMYTYEEAVARCRQKGGQDFSPCFGCDPIPTGR